MLKTKLIRANTQVVDGAAGKVHAVVSTEARDRDGDVVRAGGWDLEAFMEHPILLASHSYHQLRSQIGEWEEMKVAGARLEGVARYYVGEGNPEADWGFNLASKGMAAYSVGFIPDMARARALGRDGGWSGYEFNGQELLEVSHVTIPSNPDALQRLKAAGIHPAVAEVVEALRSFQRGAPVEGERGLRYTQRHGQSGREGDPVQALAVLFEEVAGSTPSPDLDALAEEIWRRLKRRLEYENASWQGAQKAAAPTAGAGPKLAGPLELAEVIAHGMQEAMQEVIS